MLPRTSPILGIGHVTVRYSSLAAIYRGIQDSKSRDGRSTGRPSSQAGSGPPWKKRGRVRKTDDPARKWVATRFNDDKPNHSANFRRNLDWQLQHSRSLRDDMKDMVEKEKGWKGSDSSSTTGFEGRFADAFDDKFDKKSSPSSGFKKPSPRGNERISGPSFDRSNRSSTFGRSRDEGASRFGPRSSGERTSERIGGRRLESGSNRGSQSSFNPLHSPSPLSSREVGRRESSGGFNSQEAGFGKGSPLGRGPLNMSSPSVWPDKWERGRIRAQDRVDPRESDRGRVSPSDMFTLHDNSRKSNGIDSRGSLPPSNSQDGEQELEMQTFRSEKDNDRNDVEEDKPFLLSHTTAVSQFLYGHSVVESALKYSKRKLYELHLHMGDDPHPNKAYLEKLALKRQVPVTKTFTHNELKRYHALSNQRPHNGLVLEASPIPQPPLESLGEVSDDAKNTGFNVRLAYQSKEEADVNGTGTFIRYSALNGRMPFILFLDSILDPENLGAILRSAAFFGVSGVAITKYKSAGLTPVALKASSGAAEIVPLFSVSNSLSFLEQSKQAGWTIYSAVAEGPHSKKNSFMTVDRIEQYNPLASQPTILCLGNEGEGLSKQVLRLSDYQVSIPSQNDFLGVVDSLNVSVAAGILCSAFAKKSNGLSIEHSRKIRSSEEDDEKEGDDAQLW